MERHRAKAQRVGLRKRTTRGAHVDCPLLQLPLYNRQLDYARALPFLQHVHENRRSIWKRQGITVRIRGKGVNFAKSGHAKTGVANPAVSASREKTVAPVVFHIVIECEFGPWKQAHSDGGLPLRSKTARGCAMEAGYD
jgi:hypothetical protein